MVYRNTSLCGSIQSPRQIPQERQACTDLPFSHTAKVKMGINHAPRPTAEMICIKDKSLSDKHTIYLLVYMSCTENPMMEGGIQPL